MRKLAVAVVIVVVAAGSALARADTSEEGDIVVEIRDLKNDDGFVRCGLYRKSNWLEEKEAVQWVDAEYGEGDTATCRFEAMKPGAYGVGAFHDEDADHDMDNNILGIPTEGVCVSNDPEPGMTAPDFPSAKFRHVDGDTSVPCTMRY